MREEFENAYRNMLWLNSLGGSESGPGSSFECSHEYLYFLRKFVDDNNIKTILDLGCGDFNLMRHFNLTNITYKGIDVVGFVIDSNNKKYVKKNISFECNDISKLSFYDIQLYDLVLIKDVFQHINNSAIEHILFNLKHTKRCLITNDYTESNIDCAIAGYRPINIQINPFFIKGNWAFEWNSCGFYKKCFLIE